MGSPILRWGFRTPSEIIQGCRNQGADTGESGHSCPDHQTEKHWPTSHCPALFKPTTHQGSAKTCIASTTLQAISKAHLDMLFPPLCARKRDHSAHRDSVLSVLLVTSLSVVCVRKGAEASGGLRKLLIAGHWYTTKKSVACIKGKSGLKPQSPIYIRHTENGRDGRTRPVAARSGSCIGRRTSRYNPILFGIGKGT